MKTALHLGACGTLLWTCLAGNVAAQQLPDIAGVRLGMPAREGFAALQAKHPKVKLDTYAYPLPTIDKPVLYGFSLGFSPVMQPDERIAVQLTLPPEKQAVWKVRRLVGKQKIFRANLIASLREKYGKEAAGAQNGTLVSDADKDAHELWWIFDGQGHPGKFPSAYQSAYMCFDPASKNDQTTFYGDPEWRWGQDTEEDAIQDEGWCNTSIMVVAYIGGSDIVTAFAITAIHMPLALRSARPHVAWLKDLANRQQQQQITESKQAKPDL